PTPPPLYTLSLHDALPISNWGFDFIKLDFLSHGSLEGIHYDASVKTGIQAYNQGMQYLRGRLNGKMFLSESIAPIFPYQYAHSRSEEHTSELQSLRHLVCR